MFAKINKYLSFVLDVVTFFKHSFSPSQKKLVYVREKG